MAFVPTMNGIQKGQLNFIVASQKKKKRFKSANQLIATIKSWDSVDIPSLSDNQLSDHASVLVSHLNWALGEWGWQKRKTYVTLHRILRSAENQLDAIWTEVMVRRQHLDTRYGLADAIERLEWAFKQQKDIFEARRIVVSSTSSPTVIYKVAYSTGATTVQ